MKRRHLRQDIIDLCAKARDLRPEIEFGADIITGFPTETEDMFQNTLGIVEECDLTYLHVFPYSEREGTPAARIPDQVDPKTRKERAKRLRDLGDRQLQKLLKRHVNTMVDIIVEKDNFGRSESFAPVALEQDLQPGMLARVQLTAINGDKLLGVAA